MPPGIKTFVNGETLTASDVNTYMANAGWVSVGEGSVAGSATTDSFDNYFDGSYELYRIFLFNLTAASSSTLTMRFRLASVDSSTGYYYGGNATTFAGVNAVWNGNNAASISLGVINTTPRSSCTIDIANVDNAATTTYHVQFSGTVAGYNFSGYHSATTAYDGFSLVNAVNITAGSFYVYGYRDSTVTG